MPVAPSKAAPARSESIKSEFLGEITTDTLRKIRPAEEALRAASRVRSERVEEKAYEEAAQQASRQPAPTPNIPAADREGKRLDLARQDAAQAIGPYGPYGPPPPTRTPEASPSWHAWDSPGDASADTGIAVSTTHVVVTTRTTVGFFDRQGNRLRPPFQINELFGAGFMSALGVDRIFDSRSIYDPFRKRFWVATLANNGKPQTDPQAVAVVLMAVSRTENPMDGWYLHFWWSGWSVSDGHDYLALGISSKCFIQTNTAVGSDGWYHNIAFGNADAMAAGLNGEGWRLSGLTNPATGNLPDHVQPVSHHGQTDFLYLAGRDGNSIVAWQVLNPLRPNQAISTTAYPVQAFAGPPHAPQPDGALPVWFGQLGNWVLKAVWRANRLYVVTADARNWFGDGEAMTSIRVIRINLSPGPVSGNRVQIDRVFGCNNAFDDAATQRVYYGFPAIEVGKSGNMVIVYSRTGTTLSPEARISGWLASGADILPSRALKRGERPYKVSWAESWGVYPWADLAGATVDPVDDEHVWVATCYANSTADNNWAVWVGRVGLGSGSYAGGGVAAVGADLI